MFLSVSLSMFFPMFLSEFLPLLLSMFLSMILPMFLSTNLSILMQMLLSIFLPMLLSMNLSIFLPMFLSMLRSTFLSTFQSVILCNQRQGRCNCHCYVDVTDNPPLFLSMFLVCPLHVLMLIRFAVYLPDPAPVLHYLLFFISVAIFICS